MAAWDGDAIFKDSQPHSCCTSAAYMGMGIPAGAGSCLWLGKVRGAPAFARQDQQHIGLIKIKTAQGRLVVNSHSKPCLQELTGQAPSATLSTEVRAHDKSDF
jgi:hypothetical protein